MSVRKVVRFVVSFGLLCVAILAQESSTNNKETEGDLKAFVERKNREVLKSLPSLSVATNIIRRPALDGSDPPARADITSDESRRLKVAIELRLRTNGIPLREGEESPTLWLEVISLNYGKSTVTSMQLTLMEAVALKRNGAEIEAETWESTERIGATPPPDFERLRSWALEIVDQFCNDYFAANPK